jgi:hypothetical protein
MVSQTEFDNQERTGRSGLFYPTIGLIALSAVYMLYATNNFPSQKVQENFQKASSLDNQVLLMSNSIDK